MTTDEQALREVVQQLEAAWNKGDSVAWTRLFTDDADFIHVLGGHFTGAAAIEQGHRAIFDTIYKGSTNKFEVEKIRFVNDSVAIVFLFATLKVVQPGLPPLINARPTLIAERRDAAWKIVTFQNTMVTPEKIPQITEALADLHPIKGQAKPAGQ
jgi:uncharacterized protein (TIGR02246 family)